MTKRQTSKAKAPVTKEEWLRVTAILLRSGLKVTPIKWRTHGRRKVAAIARTIGTVVATLNDDHLTPGWLDEEHRDRLVRELTAL